MTQAAKQFGAMTVSHTSIESSNKDSDRDIFRMRDEDDEGIKNFLTGRESIQIQDEEVVLAWKGAQVRKLTHQTKISQFEDPERNTLLLDDSVVTENN